MRFDDASLVESICWEMRQADWVRSQNRARINELFNGFPPWSDQDAKDNNINVNVNFLEGTRLAHEARTQFYAGFFKPGKYFTCSTDSGAVHRRGHYNSIVSREINSKIKRSLPYFESLRSKFALNVMHGIAPSAFRDKERWCPESVGIEDMYVPANTLLTMENLPLFARYRSFTAPELIKLTSGPKVDPGWNKELVQDCLDWIDQQCATLYGNNWPEIWSPEKASERSKSDGGFYAGDQVPVVNCFDFYFWDDDGKQAGWRRRIILDAWSQPGPDGNRARLDTGPHQNRGRFLYTSGKRIYADKLSQIVNFQFADLSAVSPFRYHSVRSLGFLMFAVCHLQNRLRCKFTESVFEALMMYFRVKGTDDVQRALKVDLVNRGFIDEALQFIPANERWQVNAQLVELGLAENRQIISNNASSFSTNRQVPPSRDETNFQTMAQLQAMTSLVNSALMQAYAYQEFEYREIFRRFCQPNSVDADVRDFRLRCLKNGVPEKVLSPECWEIQAQQVIGAGNKTLEMAIAQQLLQMRNLFDPEPQRDILRLVTETVTDDPALADAWVPDKPLRVTDSIHDAQLAAGTLMQGLPVEIKTGMNHVEYVETLIKTLSLIIERCQQKGGAKPEDITGMQMLAQHIGGHIQIIAQDPNEKSRVKKYGDILGKLMNMVKALAQQLQEAMQKQAQQGPQLDPEKLAKIQELKLSEAEKRKERATAHAQRTAQRQVQWEQEMQQKAREHGMEFSNMQRQQQHDLQVSRAQSALDLQTQQAQGALDLQQQQAQNQLDLQQQEEEMAASAGVDPTGE